MKTSSVAVVKRPRAACAELSGAPSSVQPDVVKPSAAHAEECRRALAREQTPSGHLSSAATGASLSQRITSPRLETKSAAQLTKVFRLPRFLSESEIEQLHAAAADVKRRRGDVQRSHGCAEQRWRTVYLNHELRTLLPELHAKLIDAFRQVDERAGWKLLDDRHALNLRCAEYHTVLEAGGLPIEKHTDHGSLLTLDIMLSDTSDFSGGTFQTLEADGTLQPHQFERGDAMVFQSHKFHCVTPVESGKRQVFVCELWEGLPRNCPKRCSDPWLPCYCMHEPVALYQNHSEERYYDFTQR